MVDKSGSSSVGRAIAFQAIGREFEPRLPLKGFCRVLVHCLVFKWTNGNEPESKLKSRRSSAVEHFLGKEEVMGSSPIVGSKLYLKLNNNKINLIISIKQNGKRKI